MIKVVFLGRSTDVPRLAQLARGGNAGFAVVEPGDPGARQAEVAVCWRPEPGALAAYPRLRLIHGIAAGVDNILCDPQLPRVPLCRVVATDLADGMSEFATWGALLYHRNLDRTLANQRLHRWQRVPQQPAARTRVGIMGMGVLGSRVAADLQRLGFSVHGWARRPKALDGVRCHAGADALGPFLAQTDILVCLLPLTAETRGILNRATLQQLPRGAALIHVGRGDHMVTADVQRLLEEGHLRGALVDVFEHEPLPADSPLWDTSNLIVTPHIASTADNAGVLEQIAENVRRLQAGKPLLNLVDPALGY